MIEFIERYWWQLGIIFIAIITTYIKVKELEKRMNLNDEKTNKCYDKILIHEEELKHIDNNFNIIDNRLEKQSNNFDSIHQEMGDIKTSVVKTETIITEIFKKFN